jgi:hypothetical protein
MIAILQKFQWFIAGGALFALWALMIVSGHADADLISAIKYALVSVVAAHMSLQVPPQGPA